ncbi:MAG TPA: 2-C-methyl-D-erythritol 4-phosphate cytidylyltransferase [Ruminococcaceae bacterium]|nr:2-C-methyl-D-erythritol 4-phosphate cytidylyltransferase [Oscillospiraceae bacterium]HCC01887.1 2-C-methyl-D-erythritol 4-phosphate cytidylyltransferase [Oscillospiraceae bacterium]
MKRSFCCAMLLAAGKSTRMGMPKQEIPLLGVPALIYTLRAFEQAESVGRTVLVCPAGQEEHFRRLAEKWNCAGKLEAVVAGGETRQQSAAAGAASAGNCHLLAVHDGARVLITPEEINLAVKDAAENGASALAVPVKNTIKVINSDGFVTETPERSSLWAVQTPQVFDAQQYRNLLAAADGDFTDDCQIFERAGVPVHLCRGSYANLKLTTPEDVPTVEAILQKRSRCK